MSSVAMLLIGNIRTDGRVQKEILTLRNAGFSVTLIQWPNQGTSGDHAHLEVDVIDYPHVLSRVAAVNFVRQILFNVFAWRQLRRLAPRFVQCNDLNTLLAGWLFRRHAQVIYDAHELYPESQEGYRRWVWSAVERWLVPCCRSYIQPEQNRLAYFAKKYDIDPNEITLVENFPRADYSFTGRDRLREYFDLPEHVVVLLCTGVFGRGRDIETIVDSMALLDDRYVLVLLGTFVGDNRREVVSRISKSAAPNRVLIHPEVPNVEMLDFINASDIGLVFYRNSDLNNYWCASNKLYEFILCGKPLITNAYPGLLEVVAEQHLGVCLPEVTAPAIAVAVRALVCDGRRSVRGSPYLWEKQEATYLELFNDRS